MYQPPQSQPQLTRSPTLTLVARVGVWTVALFVTIGLGLFVQMIVEQVK